MTSQFTLTIQATLLPLLALFISCGSGSSGNYGSPETYDEKKNSIKQSELLYPVNFISLKGNYRKNVLGEWVLEGTVTSNASVVIYKDLVIEVQFFSKTNSLLGQERFTIYEYLPPNESKPYKIKTMGYQGTHKLNWDIISAKDAN